MTVIISAYNEEDCIENRLRNLLEVDYPADKLNVLIGSDGSQDDTASKVEPFVSPQIKFVDFENNRGKASVLNDLVEAAQTDLLVFSDANTYFAPNAVRQLVKHLADDTVVAVSGELRVEESEQHQESFYWRLEQKMKQSEGELDALLGANGAIYALRKSAYSALPPDTIIDDFEIVMTAALCGGRVVYEPSAVAIEEAAPGLGDEYMRRVRIGLGNYRAMFRHPEYLTRSSFRRAFCYFSHKIVRWLVPLFLLLALLSSSVLALDSVFFRWVLGAQIIGYALLLTAFATRTRIQWPSVVQLPLHLLTLNLALAHGFLRFVSGSRGGAWARTRRDQ
ncbi:MAG: glycosyltransferase family 2 protein [Pseudomonadota bacterium]